jgi:CHAT domain-containing protein
LRALIGGLADGPSDGWRAHAQALARQILPPPAWFDGITRLVVVPGGLLALLPFDLLPMGNGLLVEQAAVTYTPSAATLLRGAPPAPGWRAPWTLQLEAFADPAFTSAALDDAAAVRPRLAGTVGEVRSIAAELTGASRLHVGADNRKAHLLSAPARPPILHIASHAFADANTMEQSRIMFSPSPELGADADYLFLREAYRLDLAGVELAVLSACDTERGRLARAEGVQSFSRAFLAAGARSTVTTLWRVADQPTADFMAVFYHHLQSGIPRDEALRRTKVRFLASGAALASPHFWAAFALSGDGLRPIPRAMSWAWIVLPAGALAAAIGLAALRLRRRVALRPVDAASA